MASRLPTNPAPTTYPSPLEGIDTSVPLPTTKNADGKSLTNLEPTVRSRAYEEFVEPITKNNNGFDFHSEYIGDGGGVT